MTQYTESLYESATLVTSQTIRITAPSAAAAKVMAKMVPTDMTVKITKLSLEAIRSSPALTALMEPMRWPSINYTLGDVTAAGLELWDVAFTSYLRDVV